MDGPFFFALTKETNHSLEGREAARKNGTRSESESGLRVRGGDRRSDQNEKLYRDEQSIGSQFSIFNIFTPPKGNEVVYKWAKTRLGMFY